ncbi:MAG: gliding motility-associated protein GldE [Bacteroidales bacterium]|nr:gliding motility-associated protein GldE [Bacteroidales bacterium]
METILLFESNNLAAVTLQNINIGNLIGLFIVLLLLISSALISGSEVAFFSLSPSNRQKLIDEKSGKGIKVITLLNKPEKLLATILIANNFVNVGIVILSTFLTDSMLVFTDINAAWIFVIKVIMVTFLLLLFGEIIPKVYAAQFTKKFSLFMAYPVYWLTRFFSPISTLLINSTSFVNRRLAKKKPEISMRDLSSALELTSNQIKDNKKILEGIVSYGTTDASEIMKPRVDIVAFDIYNSFGELIEKIKKHNVSRIPIYAGTFDTIKGVLFVKDLLPHFHKKVFNWQSLIRPAYFVPESKKINDLLIDFQTKKIHMAIVIDEYGGTSGIVTLEDVLEEIVGEIVDELDYDDMLYKKIDDNNYIFEGKTLLIDFYKILNLEDDIFDPIRGEADTLAGLILEMKGEIMKIGSTINYKNFIFKIISSDKRRIKQIKVTIKPVDKV